MASNNQNITMSVHDIDTNNPSICIPRTFANVTWQLVKDAFDEIFGVGFVERVDVIDKVDEYNKQYKKIFIHFNKWPDTDYAKGVKNALVSGKTIKVVYQYPWYWKCVMSNVPKRNWNGRKPYIEIEGHTPEEIQLQGAKTRLFSQTSYNEPSRDQAAYYESARMFAEQAIRDVDKEESATHTFTPTDVNQPIYQPHNGYNHMNCDSTDINDISLQHLEEGGAGYNDPVPGNF